MVTCMRKRSLIPTLLAASAVALSVAACTVTKNADAGTNNDGVNVHIGDGSLNVDTPLFKVDKAGRGDKLHLQIPQMKIESK